MNSLQVEAEAYAFRKMAEHFRKNTGVQNIDVMNTAGFCRNCLSKWLHAGAHSAGLGMTYDDACEIVYGMPYADWKKKFQTKATPEQLEKFNATKSMHAKHDNIEPKPTMKETECQPRSGVVMSDVCCEDPSKGGDSDAAAMVERISRQEHIRTTATIRVGILTVSDRASAGVYEDLSGPEVQRCIETFSLKTNAFTLEETPIKRIVPDELDEISQSLLELSQTCNLILTTGGTGLSPRDVTPEATLRVVQREVKGIPEAVRRETSKVEPLAVLSRAVAGIRNDSCLIINLPGRPKACREAMAVILPILGHAVSQLARK